MATTTKDFDPSSAAARLHRLEEVVKSLDAPEGFDLTAFVESFNRLYKLSLGGQMSDPAEPITWDLPDSSFRFVSNNTTLIKEMLGEYFSDYDLKTKPLAARVLGGDEQGLRTAGKSLLQHMLGSPAWEFESSSESLAGKVLGSQALVTQALEGPDAHAGSVLELLLWIIDKQQLDYAYLKARIDGLSGA